MVSTIGLVAACASDDALPRASVVENAPGSSAVEATTATDESDAAPRSSAPAEATTEPTSSNPGEDASIVIDTTATTIPIDPRLFGTNLPAWVGPGPMSDPAFGEIAVELGSTLIRMPGGSWSNSYDWLACETGDDESCYWTWAARPTDFVGFLRSTGLPGSWTVNVNETAQAAAAAVAFFNGDADDTTVIGVDRNGVDWGTVGRWAQIRVDNGHPEPAEIRLWEVGNEVYGGRPDAGGEQCASFGWEDVWTCDGTEYVLGDDDHDGYLATRAAMLAVDPDIEVGAVGVAPPSEWSDFGSEVISAAGDDLDFYVLHASGFGNSPTGDEALRRAPEMWPRLIDSVRDELDESVPIAVTEYNLVAFASGDTEAAMTTAQNALFIADTLGQLASAGVSIANQWDFANNADVGDGTDYGLIDIDYRPYPAAEAFRAWADAGSSLLPTIEVDDLRIYPTRHDDGRLTIVAINTSDEDVSETLAVIGPDHAGPAVLDSVRTTDLAADEMVRDPVIDYETLAAPTEITFPAWSINRLDVGPSG